MTRGVPLLLLLVAGCAATRVERVPFSELMPPVAEAPAPAPAPAGPRTPRAQKDPGPSLELDAALMRFATRARTQRRSARPGAAMPPEQAENWTKLLTTLDAFLALPLQRVSSFDMVRARVTAEAELENDAKAYGDFPSALAEAVVERVTQLGFRVAQVRPLHRLVDPRAVALDWPVRPVLVTSLFGARAHPITGEYGPHFGVDLQAASGQLVTAAAQGTVLQAGWAGGYGYCVELQHANGTLTRYAHLSVVLVEVGALIDRGDPVGLAGSTGLSTGPHLHFEVIREGRARDPLEELGAPTPLDRVALAP